VRSAARFWISTFLNSVNNAESISVSISAEKKRPVQNLIPVMSGIIIVPLAWMTYFFAEIVANTGQEKDVGPLEIISARNVEPCPIVRSN
jgi:hypothetical protein